MPERPSFYSGMGWFLGGGRKNLVRRKALPLAYHRVGKRAFEKLHGLRFARLVSEVRRAWRENHPTISLAICSQNWEHSRMVIYGAAIIERFTRKYSDARDAAARFLTLTAAATWKNFTELRQTFPAADLGKRTGIVIFDVGGNKYRVLAAVDFESQELDIRAMLTHAEYDREKSL